MSASDPSSEQEAATVDETPAAASNRDDDQAPRVRPATLVLGSLVFLLAGVLVGYLLHPMTSSSDTVAIPAADSVDVGFAQDMTVHHSQAVEMSAVELANGSDSRVRDIAYDILTSQQNQIGQMQGWLAIWGRSAVPVGAYMQWMDHSSSGDMSASGDMADMNHSGHDATASTTAESTAEATTMPGMATSEQMAQLRAATGVDVDRIFLDLMMTHHRGGVAMMEQAADRAESPVVRRLAESMLQTQTSELDVLSSLRAQLG